MRRLVKSRIGRKISVLFLLALCALYVRAEKVEIVLDTPGSLSGQLEGIADITELYISGRMNADDFRVFYDDEFLSGTLQLLDISKTDVLHLPDNALAYCRALVTVILPEKLQSIGNDAFLSCTGLLRIIIPETVTSIGEYAFADCESLLQITIPEKITKIEHRTFDNCKSLKEVFFPSGLKEIGNGAFWGFAAEKIDFPETLEVIGEDAFYDSSLQNVYLPGKVNRIGVNAFVCCDKLARFEVSDDNKFFSAESGVLFDKEKHKLICYPAGKNEETYTVPPSVNVVGKLAFKAYYDWEEDHYVSALKEIVLPETLYGIEESAFSGCVSLDSITIPSTVREIGLGAFTSCQKIKNIVIPEGVTELPTLMLYSCTSLEDISLPSSLTVINEYAFSSCSSLEKIVLPEGVVSLGPALFNGCKNLKEIVFPKCIESIDIGMFANCTSLKEIVIPQSVSAIHDYAFYECTSLEKVKIHEGVEWIGQAFSRCTSLKQISIPSSVSFLYGWAFFESENLDSLCIYAVNPPDIGDGGLELPEKTSVYVPIEALETYKRTESWSTCKLFSISASDISVNRTASCGVRLGADGHVYVYATTSGTVSVYGLDGRFIERFSLKEGENGLFGLPEKENMLIRIETGNTYGTYKIMR